MGCWNSCLNSNAQGEATLEPTTLEIPLPHKNLKNLLEFSTTHAQSIEISRYNSLTPQSKQSISDFHLLTPLSDGKLVFMLEPVTLENGEVYEGEWDFKGHRHGRGKEIGLDKTQYIGYFTLNERGPYGKVKYASGSVYIGQLRNGTFHGLGRFIDANGNHYEGEFKDNHRHGSGTETCMNGAKYTGQYLNDLKHGKGEFEWSDGKRYKGEFVSGHMEGFGILVWPSGKSYKGMWKQGDFHGCGEFTWESGLKYIGQYKHGKRHGKGTIMLPDGTSYETRWRHGQQLTLSSP